MDERLAPCPDVTPELWRDIEDAFHHATELSPEARATYLVELGARDASLHAELTALLAADQDADAILHGTICRGAAALLVIAPAHDEPEQPEPPR